RQLFAIVFARAVAAHQPARRDVLGKPAHGRVMRLEHLFEDHRRSGVEGTDMGQATIASAGLCRLRVLRADETGQEHQQLQAAIGGRAILGRGEERPAGAADVDREAVGTELACEQGRGIRIEGEPARDVEAARAGVGKQRGEDASRVVRAATEEDIV
ncbi:MAG: hypothetical protein ACK56I_18795, partial [bacterium]